MWNEIQKSSEVQQIESTITSTPIKSGEGISKVANELGIRLSELHQVPDLGSLQKDDTFQLIRFADGSGKLIKMRTNTSYSLSKESIYQNIEKWPSSFPQIEFIRTPSTNEYQLTGKNGVQLSKNPIIVSTTNLDSLRSEIDKISWVFITECASRKEISELSCTINKGNWGNGFIEVNSKKWYDILSELVSMEGIQKLLKTPHSSTDIAWALAKSFVAPSQRPTYENVTATRPPKSSLGWNPR